MLQTEALDILKMGHNVYLTGAAGSGKTHVLNEFIAYLKEHGVKAGITASTGIAATHMGGMTIHSWAGIGILDSLSESDIERLLGKSALKKRFRETKVLIIDEVSMLHGARLDMVDTVCRAFLDDTKPFGGLQVVLSGDLFQLPPVTRGGDPDFVFQSQAWHNMNLKICYLSEQYRQEDQRLLDVLSAIRSRSVEDSHFEHLQDRHREAPSKVVVTKLYTHNADVDELNKTELSSLDSDEHVYHMQSSGNQKAAAALAANCLAPERLVLKEGAEVMFVANSPSFQYVNGTLGRVVGFDGDDLPIVETDESRIYVSKHNWTLEDGDREVAQITQLPLRLAWAITVHKSQGMSLDAAEVDLSKSFEPGMGYVALSRVRSLDGLYIKGINNTAMIVNDVVSALDKQLLATSERTRSELAKLSEDQRAQYHDRVRLALRSDEDKLLASYDKKLFEDLRTWRAKQAIEQSVPAYVILSDKTLKFIAALKPKDKKELSKIKGIGEQKLDRYGDDVLALVG